MPLNQLVNLLFAKFEVQCMKKLFFLVLSFFWNKIIASSC